MICQCGFSAVIISYVGSLFAFHNGSHSKLANTLAIPPRALQPLTCPTTEPGKLFGGAVFNLLRLIIVFNIL
jgi:hypothetical protein